MASKKKITLRMDERLKVLDDLKKFSVSTVAKKYMVHPSTVWRIKNNARKVVHFAIQGEMQQKRRRIRASLYDELEQRLLAWFVERRTFGDLISNAVLAEKAREFKNNMGLANFKASKGWLDGFKQRHNIRLVEVYEETASADEDSSEKFRIFEEEERIKSTEEENEEKQDDNQEIAEQRKKEELSYLLNRLEQHVLEKPPFTKAIFKALKDDLLGTDDNV